MGFIVEVTARSGRVLERYRFDRLSATVGRAFDNDIIVHDPYVDAHHLRITGDLNGLAIENLTAQAHTAIGHRNVAEGRVPVSSGTQAIIGKTHLRVFSPTHRVAPVLAFERVDRFFTTLTQPLFVALLTLAYLILDYTDNFMSSFRETTIATDALTIVTPLVPALGWAAAWALISRISRGEPRFSHHWVAVVLALTLMMAFDRVAQVIAFNIGSIALNEVFNYVTIAVTLVFLFVINLRFAFRQRTWVRHAFAYGTTTAILAYIVLSSYSFTREFSPYPEYDSTVMPQVFLWSRNITENEFLAEADALFDFPPSSRKRQAPTQDPTAPATASNQNGHPISAKGSRPIAPD